MYRNFTGENYNKNLTIEEIGKKVSIFIKLKIEGGFCFDLKTDCNTIYLTLKECKKFKAEKLEELDDLTARKIRIKVIEEFGGTVGDEEKELFKMLCDEKVKKGDFLNKDFKESVERIKSFMDSFLVDDSDAEADYFSTNFKSFISIEF